MEEFHFGLQHIHPHPIEGCWNSKGVGVQMPKFWKKSVNNTRTTHDFIIMTRIFTISSGIDIQIKLKMLDSNNSANPQVA